MGQVCIVRALEVMMTCRCGARFEDRVGYVSHVREGMPAPIRRKRPNYPQQEIERRRMLEYIERHRLMRNDSFEKKMKGDNNGVT